MKEKIIEILKRRSSRHFEGNGVYSQIEYLPEISFDDCADEIIALVATEKKAYIALENVLAKTEAALLTEKGKCRQLDFMVKNGLGYKDMQNDITMPHEI